jgi:hypothetical protein
MWKVVAASVAGRSHVEHDRPCEDASGYESRSALVCLVVADGAGTRSRAQSGAETVVSWVRRLAREQAELGTIVDLREWVIDAFRQAREQLRELASAEHAQIGDYATTLAIAVITEQTLCVGQIGDTIVVIGRAGRYETCCPPSRFEYANETAFLTSADYEKNIRISQCDAREIDDVVLSTDGLRFQIVDNLKTYAPYVPFFQDVAAYTRKPDVDSAAVRDFLRAIRDQSGDDKSIVIAVRIDMD